MKTRDEISAMLGGFVDAKPDEQGTLIAGVLDEFDECRNEAEQFTKVAPMVHLTGMKPMIIYAKIMLKHF